MLDFSIILSVCVCVSGDPSVLVRLIHDGRLIPDQMDQHSEEELRDVLEKCGIPAATHSDKVHSNTHTHTHTLTQHLKGGQSA